MEQCLEKINKEQQSSNSFGLQKVPESGGGGCMGAFKDFFSGIKNKFS